MVKLLWPSRGRAILAAGFLVALGFCGLLAAARTPLAADSLPATLSDEEFWKLVVDSSEADGFFRSDNLMSNEAGFQEVVPELLRTSKPGRVYLGVGPEQNFTYIAAVRPSMAFIVDIRRGNLDLQLMYKALFELSVDRADFVSRLFAQKRPDGLTATSTAAEIFAAFSNVEPSDTLYKENLSTIQQHLVATHGFPLSRQDLDGIEYVYRVFYSFGPRIRYSSSTASSGPYQPTYASLMTATDARGQPRGYLASEENFQILKDLERRNLVVPLIGNFGGPKAIRAVGRYLKERGATVSAFYLSNVEQYLRMDGIWRDFCGNVAALPLDETSTFIRSVRRTGDRPIFGLSNELGNMMYEVKGCQ